MFNRLQINDVSTFYLSLLMLPVLRRASIRSRQPSRLTMVASDVHYWTELDEIILSADKPIQKLNDRQYTKNEKVMGQRRYFDSKRESCLFKSSGYSKLFLMNGYSS